MRLRKILFSYPFLVVLSILVSLGVYGLFVASEWSLEKSVETVAPIAQYSSPTPTTKIPPTRIRITTLKKDLPVQAALVRGNDWDMFDDAIAWLSTSAVPGEGNVILYGHNRTRLFGDLYKLKAGDVVEVEQNGAWRRYSVTESRAVKANDVDSILSDEDRLTLYTCEGSFDQKRRVVYANPL